LGASVIIYPLILEELLREAHQTDAGLVEVAILFACFLPFFLAGIAVG
jgi:ZIP family zinc transporter